MCGRVVFIEEIKIFTLEKIPKSMKKEWQWEQ